MSETLQSEKALLLKEVDHLSQELIISERRRRETQRLSGVGFWELEHTTGKLYWSEEIYAIYDLQPDEKEPSYELFVSLIYEPDQEFVHNAYQESVKQRADYNIRYRVKAGNSVKWIEARGITYYDDNGNPERSIGTALDISEIKDAQDKIEHMAYHDMLTGLANRKLFTDKLNAALLSTSQNQTYLAILFIDLDNFKRINDKFGHGVGDRLLTHVAKRLSAYTKEGEVFARIGGDEFAGILFGNNDAEIKESIEVLKQIIESVYEMQLVKFKISASIGVTIYPHDQADVDILIRHADQAMYEAKDRGKSEICYFDINRSRSIETRKKLLKDIQHALTNNQFEIFYQPRIRLSDGKLAGAEALLRWETPQGQIPPSEIVAALRNSYGEWELDNWVIEKVLSDIKHFKEKRLDGPYSINVNPSSIENPTFPDVLNTVLRKWNIAGEDIEIEILEIESIKNFDLARNILNQCKALGVNFSLDDFGTGYSSLTYFHALPISKVKIDQRFIKSAHADPDSLLLVRSILAVANANNKPVIAEGIETETIAKTLTELDCGYGQGFGIAIPMPMHDYINWALSTASDSSTPKKLM